MHFGIKHYVALIVLPLTIAMMGVAIFIYSGSYNIGADDHHTKPVFRILETLRDRSVKTHARNIVVPKLDDEKLILKGAGQYAAMCTGCHLIPGKKDSEIRHGLYPLPPDLTQVRMDPNEAFWVIKHGIKMSAMPAWGGNHDDATIWSMVAFLQKLPDLSPQQYKDIVTKAPPDKDMEPNHTHRESDGMPMGHE